MKIFDAHGAEKYHNILRFQYELLREQVLFKVIFRFGYESFPATKNYLYKIAYNKDERDLCEGTLMSLFRKYLSSLNTTTTTSSFKHLLNQDLEQFVMSYISADNEILTNAEIRILAQAISEMTDEDPTVREKLSAFISYHIKYRLISKDGFKVLGDRRTYDYQIPLLKKFTQEVAPIVLSPLVSNQLNSIIFFHAENYDLSLGGFESECELLKLQKNELDLVSESGSYKNYISRWK